MKQALIEYDGQDNLLGVWVWDDEQPDRDPEIAYPNVFEKMLAENALAEYHPDEGQTWGQVMEYLVGKAHPQHYRRWAGPTDLSARELLNDEAALAKLRAA